MNVSTANSNQFSITLLISMTMLSGKKGGACEDDPSIKVSVAVVSIQ